ncbi:hypothetical protein K0I73_04610 [Shewanella mesophila]|uniref:hypothetical protein n=1 Tax=Shewanella mesophila TaxID=2864208 RepID=UPI001C655CBF|nr:hypothetical protein [Shewanella mesophila]QYJ87020.1 hypothetical protein K0I73_04610 [Shewanella mesophila]
MTTHDNQLDTLIANASRELTPAHDLWPQIEHRLETPITNQNRYWRPVAIASLLLLSMIAGQQYVTSNLMAPELTPLLTSLESIRAQHQQQVLELQNQVQKVNWQSSQYGQPVEQGVEQLKAAAEQIYRTLQLNPTDKQLWQLWLWTQEREIDLLRQGQRLPINQKNRDEII